MRRPTRWEVGTVAGFLLVYTVISLFAKPGAALTAFSDTSGAGLWLIAVVVLLWAGFGNRGRTRWFWFLMAFGAALVGTNFAAWLYYEVITGREPPNPFWADIPLFLQPVPMMAAAAMRPGSRQREQKFLLSTLNFLFFFSGGSTFTCFWYTPTNTSSWIRRCTTRTIFHCSSWSSRC